MKFRPNPFRSLVVPAMAATSLLLSTAGAATLYWKTSAAASWTSSSWATAAGGPYTAAWAKEIDIMFESDRDAKIGIISPVTSVGPLNFGFSDSGGILGSTSCTTVHFQVQFVPEHEAVLLGGLGQMVHRRRS